ncbi:hypothetical protein OG379_36790 [Streptomyces sp. NBC_01166]|uniref:YhfZ family protein n=1 Tax=Streptomyces sp. NBC_01166 TaxID=2903755 RepID=UPI00386D40A0|nr:hypothetical protein OG379_36790 [Streptomyces sp. NBC_01166]
MAASSSTTPVGTTPREVIARDVLRAGIGGRLPTTVHYQESLGVGSGTVQKALKDLRNEGAMSLVARGHQGTYITELDAALLWSAARLSPVHLLLPPNAPPESMRVATAVAERFAPVGAYTTAGHLRGAEARLQAIEARRADIALMSAGAAGDLLAGGPAGHRTLTLGSGTYYAPGSLVVVTRAGGQRHGANGAEPRIGIDLDSDDHQRLTHAEFPEGVGRYVPTDFTSVPRAVLLGEIDAGIWHTVDSLIPLDAAGLTTTPLTRPDAVELARAISAAVLVATQDNIPGVLLSRATGDGGDLLAASSVTSRTALPGGDEPLRLRV